MRRAISVLCLVFATATASATTYLVTLGEKLSFSCFIARVRIVEATAPKNLSDPASPVALRAEILELFKGPKQKEILFASHAYAHLAAPKLPELVGKEFLVFLHDPDDNGKLWLFEGPRGMRPILDEYSEYRFDVDRKIATDHYSQKEYLEILRNWKAHASTEKKHME